MFTRYSKFKKLRERLIFTLEDLEDLVGIRHESARVLCTRYVRNGLFIRLKRNLYISDERWNNLSREDLLRISNLLQVPSYISFITALSIYEATTQVQRGFFESASLRRSVSFEKEGMVFNYYKLKRQYYFDFVKKDDIFIATKEKAFLDAVYLYSFGKYKIDFSSLDLDKLDKNRIKKLLKLYPEKTRGIVKKICRI